MKAHKRIGNKTLANSPKAAFKHVHEKPRARSSGPVCNVLLNFLANLSYDKGVHMKNKFEDK